MRASAELSAHVSRRARPARALGPRSRAALRGRAGGERARGVGRPAGLRLRVRRPDRSAVGARRGAVGTRRRHRLAAVRAGAAGVLCSGADSRNALAAGGGKYRGAAGRFSNLRATGDCPCRAPAVRRTLPQRRRPWKAPCVSSRRRVARGALELVGEEILELVRGETTRLPSRSSHPPLERWRAPLETAFAGLGIPYAVEGRRASARRRSAARCSRCFASPGSAAAVTTSTGSCGLRTRVSAATTSTSSRGGCAGAPSARPSAWRRRRSSCAASRCRSSTRCVAGSSSHEAVGKLAASMLPAAHGLGGPPTSDAARLDLRAFESTLRALEELDAWQALTGNVDAEDVVYGLERAVCRRRACAAARPCRGARHASRAHEALRDRLRARPRGGNAAAGAPARRACSTTTPGARSRSGRAAPGSRGRIPSPPTAISSTRRARARRVACTSSARPRRTTGRRASRARSGRTCARCSRPTTSHGGRGGGSSRRRPGRWIARRRSASVCARSPRWPPMDPDATTAVARANGWDRRLDRARVAFSRPTRLTHPVVLERAEGARRRSASPSSSYSPTAPRCGSSSASSIHGRSTRASTPACAARWRTRPSSSSSRACRSGSAPTASRPSGSTRRSSSSRSASARRSPARRAGIELTDVERLELEQGLLRDLGEFVRGEARSELPLVPRRFEVSFGSERSAPGLKAGLDLGGFAVSGKIDRVDLDPFSARGIVQDYKSGKAAHSAAKIESELKLQIPLYMLVLRDLLGVEPVGGLYRALAGERSARGVLRASAREDLVPGFSPRDYLDDEAFWALVDQAVDRARGFSRPHPGGTRLARSEGRFVPVVVRARPHLPGEAPVTTVTEPQAPNPEQAVAIDAGGHGVRLGGRRHGQDDGHRRAVRPRRRAWRRRRLDPRRDLHRARRGRAAGRASGRGSFSPVAPISHASSTARGSRRFTDSATGCSAAYPAAAGVDPRFRVLDESQASVLRAEAFGVALAEFCCGRASRAGQAARDVRRGRPAPDARRRRGDAAGSRPAARARPAGGAGSRPADRGAEGSRDEGARGDGRRGRDGRRARQSSPAPSSCSTASRMSTSCSTCPRSRSRAAARNASRRTRTCGSRWSRRRSTSLRFATATCCRSCSSSSTTRTSARRTRRARSTSRISSSAPAISSRKTRRCGAASAFASGRSWSTSSRTRTGCSARSSTSSIRKSSSSWGTSSSPSTGSGTRTWRSSGSVAPSRRACCRCARTTARGRSCSMS